MRRHLTCALIALLWGFSWYNTADNVWRESSLFASKEKCDEVRKTVVPHVNRTTDCVVRAVTGFGL